MMFKPLAHRRLAAPTAASRMFPDPSGRHQPTLTPSHARPSLFTGD